VPRWSRSSLARLSWPSVLLMAAVFTGACLCGDAGAQQLNDTDSALLAPALNGNPRSPPRFQAGAKKPKKEDGEGLGLGELPSSKFAPASGAGSTGFDSSNGYRRKLQSKSKGLSKPLGLVPGGNGSRGKDGAQGAAKEAGTSTTTKNNGNQTGKGTILDSAQDAAPAPPISPRLLQPAASNPLLTQLRNQSRPGAPPSPRPRRSPLRAFPPVGARS
jgi:hypothetical protein